MAELYAVQNHVPGEMAMCVETNQFFYWDEDKGWVEISVDNKGFEMNLYELNKNVIGQLDPLTSNEITLKMSLIDEYYSKTNNTYHMLLCRDFNYYTIFSYDSMMSFPSFSGAVCTIITELGDVYSIDMNNDGVLEIWIQPTGEASPYAFYLFPYDAGVVYYG
jgi:hypothetical protein